MIVWLAVLADLIAMTFGVWVFRNHRQRKRSAAEYQRGLAETLMTAGLAERETEEGARPKGLPPIPRDDEVPELVAAAGGEADEEADDEATPAVFAEDDGWDHLTIQWPRLGDRGWIAVASAEDADPDPVTEPEPLPVYEAPACVVTARDEEDDSYVPVHAAGVEDEPRVWKQPMVKAAAEGEDERPVVPVAERTHRLTPSRPLTATPPSVAFPAAPAAVRPMRAISPDSPGAWVAMGVLDDPAGRFGPPRDTIDTPRETIDA